MLVLGIHYGHDSNVSLIKDGKCIYAISEERVSRKKFDNRWPQQSLDLIENNFDFKNNKVDAIAIVGASRLEETTGGSFERIYKKFGIKKFFLQSIISKIINLFDNTFTFLSIRSSIAKKIIKKKLKNFNVDNNNIFFLDHHFCHAMGAFYASNFIDNSLIVTCDGKGDGFSHKNFIGKVNQDGTKQIQLISSTKDYNSIGFFYSMVTEFLGFKRMRHEGKVTGLSAYGKKIENNKESPIKLSKDGMSLENVLVKNHCNNKLFLFFNFLKLDFKLFFTILFNNAAIEGRYAQKLLFNYLEKNFKEESREDVSFYAQNILQKNIVKLIENFIKKYDYKNLCLSGGIFANVKLNQDILEKTKKNVFVMPGMDDGGLSIGASLFIYEKISNKPIIENFENIYFGPDYKEIEIEKAIKINNLKYFKEDNIEEKIAIELSKGKIIGRFNGRMEWGPRALGNRSILVSAADKSINEKLNNRLGRSEFMPFAPIIIYENAEEYFENFPRHLRSIEFMTMTLNVKKNKISDCSAVVHVDSTARPQCVKSNINNSLYKILEEYKKITKIPILVNTSFNVHEEPIVCKPEDAIRSLQRNAIDILAIGKFLVYNQKVKT